MSGIVVVVGRQRRRFIEEEDMIGIGDDGDEDDNESDVRPSILGGGGGDIAAGYGIGSIGVGIGNVLSKLCGSEEEEAVDADDGQSSLSPPPPLPPSLSTCREVLVGLSRLMMIVGVSFMRFVFVVVVVAVAVKVMLHQPSIGRCTDEPINVADDSYQIKLRDHMRYDVLESFTTSK